LQRIIKNSAGDKLLLIDLELLRSEAPPQLQSAADILTGSFRFFTDFSMTELLFEYPKNSACNRAYPDLDIHNK
jgi:hypothetical protein